VLYIVFITLLWPLCVLLISIPLGQFSFFKKYVGKLLNKLRGTSPPTSRNIGTGPLQKEREDSEIDGGMEANKGGKK
jgi:hypothetical protein